MNSWRRYVGFTLLELMVVLVIVGIGLLIAVPSYQGMIEKNQLLTHAREFQTALNYARSEAIRLNTYVVLCQSSNGTVCSAPSSGYWEGWLVRAAGAAPGNETGPVLRAYQYQDSAVLMTSLSVLATNNHAIRFSPQGLVRGFANNAPMSSGVQLCVNDGSNKVYQLQFSSAGQSTLALSNGLCS